MSGTTIEPRAHDLEEEQHAAARITAQLADKPIIGTSGNEEHRLTPVDVKVKVGLSDQGQEITFAITHRDRHHPELVYKTIEAELAKLPELAGFTPKALDAKHDICQKKGEMIIRYAAPGDKADDLIHALSKNDQDKVPLPGAAPALQSTWAEKVVQVGADREAANEASYAAKEAANESSYQPKTVVDNWAQKAVNYLLTGNSRGL